MSYEFNCWVNIKESVNEAGEAPARLQAAEVEISTWLNSSHLEALGSTRLMRAEVVSVGDPLLLVGFGGKIRNNGTTESLLELAHLVARVAPGSYGFIYILDWDISQSWSVIVIKRGVVTIEQDPWFSPVIPEVEDPN